MWRKVGRGWEIKTRGKVGRNDQRCGQIGGYRWILQDGLVVLVLLRCSQTDMNPGNDLEQQPHLRQFTSSVVVFYGSTHDQWMPILVE